MKIGRTLWIVLGVFLVILGSIWLMAVMTVVFSEWSSLIPAITGVVDIIVLLIITGVSVLFFGLGLAITALGLLLIVKKGSSPQRERKRAQREENHRKLEQRRQEQYYTLECELETGLPLAKGARCTLLLNRKTLIIRGGGVTFSIGCDKVTDMAVQTQTQLQHYFASSAGGALAGGMLFGPIGAAYGGRMRHIKVQEQTDYLVITYWKEQDLSCLLFRLTTPGDRKRARKLVAKKQQLITKNDVSVEI